MAAIECTQRDVCICRSGDLESHRALVKQLYVDDDLSLEEVLEILRAHHRVNASYVSHRPDSDP